MKFFIFFISILSLTFSNGKLIPASLWDEDDKDIGLRTIVAAGEVNCDTIPPAFWCSHTKIVNSCGFKDQCLKYLKASWNRPVQLTVFMESLCPDCQKFIQKSLYPMVHQTPIKDMVKIELVPYGNAKTLENGTIQCQHGPKECEINKYESCAIHYMSDPIPFIHCIEEYLQRGKEFEKSTKKCYSKLGIEPHVHDQVIHCVNGKRGDEYQKQAGKKTAEAWPDEHRFVPWVLFNNVSLSSEQFLNYDLPTAVCQLYVGDQKEKLCGGVASKTRHFYYNNTTTYQHKHHHYHHHHHRKMQKQQSQTTGVCMKENF